MNHFIRILLAALFLAMFTLAASGQEHDHSHHADGMNADTVSERSFMMTSTTSLSLPMTRNGSGTGWQPDASPMYAIMGHDVGGWQLMLHGSLFLRQTWTNINNSDARHHQGFSAPNYVMAMAQRRIGGNGLLSLQAMISLDPLTVGGAGYPLLFQTGETWEGSPLIDHQHPHDLFTQIAIAYTQRFSEDLDVTIYAGYPGEPALGPTTFMHRASAIANPDAPLGHHWLDATHITFGVGTLGVRYGIVKAEGSIFTGKEPDENRYNFDKPLFDSYSWRVSVAPFKFLTAQISQGYLNQPEANSTADVIRTTGSVQLAGGDSETYWSAIAAIGHNDAGHGHEEFAVLVESALDLDGTLPYVRYEWVEKSAEELGLAIEDGHGVIYGIHAASIGIAQRLATVAMIDLSIGAQAAFHFIPQDLAAAYGSSPISAQIYLRATPMLFGMF